MKLEFSRQIFEDYSDIKFHEIPSSGRRVVPCGETDVTKVIVAFHNNAKAPKNSQLCLHCYRTLNHTVCTLHAVHIAACKKGHTLSVPLLHSPICVLRAVWTEVKYVFCQFLSTIVVQFPCRCGVHPRDGETAWHQPKILIKTKRTAGNKCRIQQNMQFWRLFWETFFF